MAFDPNTFVNPETANQPEQTNSKSGFNPNTFKAPEGMDVSSSSQPESQQESTSLFDAAIKGALKGVGAVNQSVASGATGFNAAIESLPKGILKLGLPADQVDKGALTSKEDVAKARASNPIATTVGEGLGLAGLYAPVAVAAPGLISGAYATGGMEFLRDSGGPLTMEDRSRNAVIGGATALAAGTAVKGLGYLGKQALEKTGFIPHADKAINAGIPIDENLAAASLRKRVPFSPGEYTSSRVLKADEGRTPMSQAQRIATEIADTKRVNKSVKMMANETFNKALSSAKGQTGQEALATVKSQTDELFNQARAIPIDDAVSKSFEDSTKIQLALQNVNLQKELPMASAAKDAVMPEPGTIGYWDAVRQVFKSKTNEFTNQGASNQQKVFSEAASEISEALRKQSPAYNEGMLLSQKTQIYEKITNKLGSENGMFSPHDVVKKLIPDAKTTENFMEEMITAGADRQDVQDWVTIMKTLGGIDNPVNAAIKRQNVGLIAAIKSMLPGSNGRVLLPDRTLPQSLSALPEETLKAIRKAPNRFEKTKLFVNWLSKQSGADVNEVSNRMTTGE